MRRAFELDAARGDVPLAASGTAFGLKLVIFDGTTLDLFACPELRGQHADRGRLGPAEPGPGPGPGQDSEADHAGDGVRQPAALLDPDAFPAAEIAALYAARRQVETAFLHLKKTVRGAGRVLRGRSAALARQEAWALLLVHNMIAAMAARAAAAAGTSLAAVSFTAVLSLVREHIAVDTCCRHCGKRPAGGGDPLALLAAAIAGQPLNGENRKRTSGRATAERKKWPTEEAAYEITIVPWNLPKADTSPRT